MTEVVMHAFAGLFGDCPATWKIIPLPEAIDFQEGPGILAKDFCEHGVPLLRLKSIQNTYATLDGCNFLDEKKVAKKWNHFRVKLADMLVSTSATLGIVSEVTEKTIGCIPYTGIIRMRPNRQDVAPGFIKYFMQSSFFVQQAEAMASGSVLRHFGPTHLRQMSFPLPPLPTQRKIASILSAYDGLIENNTRRIAILEAMAQAIYREWFVEFRFPGHEQVKFVDSTLGKIPEGWNVEPLKRIATKIGSGATPRGGKESYKSSGIPLIRSLNIYDYQFEEDGLAFIDDEQAAQLDNVVVERRDILLNITGASVARCCMVPSYLIPARVNQHVAIIRVDFTVADPFYVLNSINSERHKRQILALAQGGATREALTKDTISNFEILLPPKGISDRYSDIITGMFIQRELLQRKNNCLRKTRDLLLPKLISGQLDVENIDIEIGESIVPTEEVAA